MRSLVIVIIILALLGGVFVADDMGLRYITKEVIKAADALGLAIQQNADAEQAMSELKNRWETFENWMLVLGNHKDVDNISISLLKTDNYIRNGDLEKAMQELEVARYLLNDLPEKDKVSWVNIF